jgi:PPK2 family polyphosphate:nucleotide phosphotransferase
MWDSMNLSKLHRIEPGKRVNLSKIDTQTQGPFESKEKAVEYTHENIKRMRDLQYKLFVEGKRSLLIVLQAPDAAGKDGLIRKVLGQMNPQGCHTHSFKVPTEEERAHDFLWRIHKCVPPAGQVAIFNRSHYEDVLVVRVEQLVPDKVWKKRYANINHFEELLADRGTKILKFFLHISHEEQLERFKARLDEPEKHWKLNAGDYAARDQWDAYCKAYEDAFSKCNSEHSPWYVIPSDRKWYRDAAVAGIVAEAMEAMDPEVPPVTVDLEEIRRLYEREASELGLS